MWAGQGWAWHGLALLSRMMMKKTSTAGPNRLSMAYRWGYHSRLGLSTPRQAGRKHNCDSKLSVYVELSKYLASYCESHIIVQQKIMKSNILQISGKLKQLHFCFVYYLLLLTAKDCIFNVRII